MRLFIVFALAKIAALSGQPAPASWWAPIAYLWQDAAVALAFIAFDRAVDGRWPSRIACGALVLLAAVNVPVARVLSSPLTVPMLRAARGTLGDSIRYHVTLINVALSAIVLVAGFAPVAQPAQVARLKSRATSRAAWALLGVVLLGPFAASRVDTRGLERHPLVALARTAWPRVQAESIDADWREGLTNADPGPDLTGLRGAARGRNVLLVVLESTAAQYLRPYGAPDDPMPTFTALAASSMVFANAYAVYPESIKGLVAILASRYPAFDVAAEGHARAIAPSIATRLSAAGYDTALFHSGRFMYLGMNALLANSGFATREDAGDIGGEIDSSFGIDERSSVRRILRWIDARPAGRRFLAAYLPVAGHHPYAHDLAGPFSDATEIGRYRNALHEADGALRELFDGLRIRSLDRSTLVVVLADHGEAFDQHPGNYGHTQAIYDENVRVPLAIAIPGVEAASGRVDRPASLIDVAPTVLDLLGLAPPAAFEGESLLAPRGRLALFFSDYSLGLLGLRDGCTKFIHELESGRSRMFDVCRDPAERDDVAAASPDRAAGYRDRLRQWSAHCRWAIINP